jgi:F0F1-type ATP synthase assembly protein I
MITGGGSDGRWKYVAAATQFTTAPLAGGFAGYWADQYFKTEPALTLLGFVLGFVTGTINLIRILKPPSK